MPANIYVDYNGSGRLVSAFHPTLQVCYMQGKILLPEITADSDGVAEYSFYLPSGLTNPFLTVDKITSTDYYFEQIYSTNWKVYFRGKKALINATGREQNLYRTPMVAANSTYIRYGGYRG